MKKIIGIFLLFITFNNHLQSIDQSLTHLVIVPGQNGLGGQNATTTIPFFADKQNQTHTVETPSIRIDFGQNYCMNYLNNIVSTILESDKVIIHASSQGTATALNYASKNHKKISALILESVMLSGNSAISYNIGILNNIPGSYYFAPYLAKFVFPFYQPAGDQAILNIENLPQDLPIIILHNTNDPGLSYQDAQALYAYLKDEKQNKNVYLMSQSNDCRGHVLLLRNNNKDDAAKINAINQILCNNKLLPNNNEPINKIAQVALNHYQPKVKQEWLNHFQDLQIKEQRIWWIDWTAKIIFYSLILYKLYKTNIVTRLITRIYI